MNVRYSILLIVLLVLIAFPLTFFYLFNVQANTESITLVEEEIISNNEFGTEVLSAKSYSVDYSHLDLKERYFIQKIVFPDENAAKDFIDNYMITYNGFMKNEETISIENYEGKTFISMSINNREKSFGLLIKNGNSALLSKGLDQENLIKVVEWFIERY